MAQEDVFKKLVSHCKEYGFVFPSSDIYDGLGAVYDYGQMGVELKNNIKQYWWQSMVLLHENIVGIDSAIFMHPTIWKASGHVDAFNDPLIDNRDSKKRYRADVLIEDQLAKYDEKINLHGTIGSRTHFGREHQIELTYFSPVLGSRNRTNNLFINDNLTKFIQIIVVQSF
jgi:glycyl-tRNA synthetase (class II)